MRRIGYLLLAVLNSVVLYFGVLLSGQEAAVFTYGSQSNPEFRQLVLDHSLDIGYSFYSKNRLMSNCMFALYAFAQQLAVPEEKRALAEGCKNLSDKILADAPYHSQAWVVHAVGAHQMGDIAGMNEGLKNSQASAPNEQWVAIMRYRLASDNLDQLTPDVVRSYDTDLALLAQSRFGVVAIAERYVKQADFRDRITNIVLKLPDDVQQRFLRNVKSAVKRL